MAELTEHPARELSSQAADIALRNPPVVVAENAFLAILTVIGWIPGRLWFYGAKFIAYCALGIRYGYRKGVKAQVAPKKKTAELPQPSNLTSFGPNVQAYSEPGP